MIQTCHHVMPSGLHCQSPAMRGSAFCYHHARRVASARNGKPAESRIELPSTLDRNGIVQALHQVLNALANGRISSRRASILLYGLQMAVDHPPQSEPASPNSVLDLLPAGLSSEIHSIIRQMDLGSLSIKTSQPAGLLHVERNSEKNAHGDAAHPRLKPNRSSTPPNASCPFRRDRATA